MEDDDSGSVFSSFAFRRRLAEGLFSAILCSSCKSYVIPPTSVCNNCLSRDLEWVAISRTGKVVTYSEIHVATKEFQDRVPYVVAIIETEEESIRLPGIVRGATLGEMRIDSRVRVNLDKVGGYFFSLVPFDSSE